MLVFDVGLPGKKRIDQKIDDTGFRLGGRCSDQSEKLLEGHRSVFDRKGMRMSLASDRHPFEFRHRNRLQEENGNKRCLAGAALGFSRKGEDRTRDRVFRTFIEDRLEDAVRSCRRCRRSAQCPGSMAVHTTLRPSRGSTGWGWPGAPDDALLRSSPASGSFCAPSRVTTGSIT